MKKIIILLLLAFLASCSSWQSGELNPNNLRIPNSDILNDTASGIPRLARVNLDPINYVPIHANKLKNAHIVWLNFDLLREKGIEIPKEGLTPQFEQKLLDEFAFMVKNDHDNPNDFLQEEKTFYADRYGGIGIGQNWGSGRAASTGDYQIKGIGQTPLIGDGQAFDHAHGGASFNEAIQEAIWGEFNHQELPFGSNRVLLIMDTGTSTIWNDGTKESRAMIVREDPIRPAHYLKALYGQGPWKETENERIHKNFLTLLNSLPLPQNVERASLTQEEIIKQGLDEFTDRIAQQFAATNARKIYHGAVSPSNIDLSGKFLDFGTETTLSDFGKAKIRFNALSFDNEVMDHLKYTIIPLKNMIQEEFKGVFGLTPIEKNLSILLDTKFKHYQKIEFLNLIGIPDHLNRKLINQVSANDLAQDLIKIAFTSSEIYNIDKQMPERMGTYSTNDIFKILGATQANDPLKLEMELGDKLPPELKKELANHYANYLNMILKEAANDGVSPEAFYQYKFNQSLVKNKIIPELYRSQLHTDNIHLIDQFKTNGDRYKVWESIDTKITHSRMTYKEFSPYQVAMNSQYNKSSGEIRHLIFDAKKNQHLIKITSPIHQAQFSFYDNHISISTPKDAPIMHYTENNWKTQQEVKGVVINDRIEFDLPIDHNTDQIELAMNSSDGKTWWKNGENNGIFKIGRYDNTHFLSNDCFSLLQLFIRD